MTLSTVVVTKPSLRTPSRLMSLPVEGALLPLVGEADDEDGEEDHHRPEARRADLAQRDRPRKQERDLEVEQDEEDRDEVVAHVELHARVFERLEAALVRRVLRLVGPPRAEQEAEDLRRDADRHPDQDEEDDGKVRVQGHEMVPTARLELAQLSPLPPQDSVSTNFTTSAAFLFAPGSHEEWLAGQPRILVEGDHRNYFCGIAAAPEAPTGAL